VSIANDNFRVIANDDHGNPARCSYCTRGAKHVVVLPLVDRSDFRAVNDEEWIGLCAFCVLEMARALARAEGKL
jgi:hypothetical protein